MYRETPPQPSVDLVDIAGVPFSYVGTLDQAAEFLRGSAGVYVVGDIRPWANETVPIDVGSSTDSGDRLRHHDRKPCWRSHAQGSLVVYHHYIGGVGWEYDLQRLNLEQMLRARLQPLCGER